MTNNSYENQIHPSIDEKMCWYAKVMDVMKKGNTAITAVACGGTRLDSKDFPGQVNCHHGLLNLATHPIRKVVKDNLTHFFPELMTEEAKE